MARFPRDFLTAREQSAILAICVLAAVGLLLGQLGGEVPLLQEDPAPAESLMAAVEDDKPVQIDIRTASREELMLLPGIGPKRAQDIIDHRSAHGFESVGDLVKIKGIGEKTLAKMLPSLLPFGVESIMSPITEVPDTPQMISLGILPQPAAATSKTSSPPAIPKTQITTIINLNTATQEELCTLPGIGEVKSRAIIDHRAQNGPFTAIEDITRVKGIGPKTFAKIRHRLSI